MPLAIAVADLAQEVSIGVLTEHAFLRVALGTVATVGHVVSSNVQSCLSGLDVLTPLKTETLAGACTQDRTVSAKFESFQDGLVAGWSLDHVVVLDQRTNGGGELRTDREGVPELVDLQGAVA